MVLADIPFPIDPFKSEIERSRTYESSPISADASASFFIAFLTGFLSRALSTALLTDFPTTLLEVFFRTVWSIALSSRLVATFLALLAFAIYQSFVRHEGAAVHSNRMRASIGSMCYRSVNLTAFVPPSVVTLFSPSRNAPPYASSKFRTKEPRTRLTRHRFPLRGAVNNLEGAS